MAGFPAIKGIFKGQKSDITVLLVTFVITIFIDLTVAIEVGLLFAAFFFIKKMIDVSEVREQRSSIVGGISSSKSNSDMPEEVLEIPQGVLVYEIEGPLFFGTVQKFEQSLSRANIDYKVIILRMRNTIYLDAGGLRALEQFKEACDKKGVTIVLSGIHTQPYMLLQKTGMAQVLGEENIYDHIDKALQRAENLVK
jgi:SulP family sulfate permease